MAVLSSITWNNTTWNYFLRSIFFPGRAEGRTNSTDGCFLSYLTNNGKPTFSSDQVTLHELELLVKNIQNTFPGYDYTDQQKKNNFFQNALKIYTCYGAKLCPKHDVDFRFSLK